MITINKECPNCNHVLKFPPNAYKIICQCGEEFKSSFFFKNNDKQIAGKTRLSLIPFKQLEEVGKVFDFGAKKYFDYGWKTVENLKEKYSDALLRHLFTWLKGDTLDDETKLSHMAHVACNALILLWEEMGNGSINEKKNTTSTKK